MKATLLVAGLFAFAVSVSPTAIRPRQSPAPIPKGFGLPVPVPVPDDRPFFDVHAKSGLNPDTRTLHEKMAVILSCVTTAPKPRLTHWSALIDSPDYGVNGWSGSITAVAKNGKGGHVVDVIVRPHMGQIRVIISSNPYREQWDVDANGNPTFVQSFDPENRAGQMPGLMCD